MCRNISRIPVDIPEDCQLSALDLATRTVLTCLIGNRDVANEVTPVKSENSTLAAHMECFQFLLTIVEQCPKFHSHAEL